MKSIFTSMLAVLLMACVCVQAMAGPPDTGPDSPTGSGVIAISIGELVAGEITDPAVAAEYSFTATPGQRVFLDVLSTSNFFGLEWGLTDVPGRQLAQTSFMGDMGLVTLLGGEYRIRVASVGAGTGTFEFRVVAPSTTTAPISTGVSVAGELLTPGDQRDYTFSATAGDRIFIDLISASDFFGFNFVLTSAGGREILPRTMSLGDLGPFTLKSGSYTLSVLGEGDATGDFEFVVEPVTATDSAVMVGDTIDDAITSPGSVNRYTFSVAAGQIIELDLIGTSNFFELNYLLEDQFGRAVIPRTNSLANPSPVDLAGGSYVLTVIGETDATGTYMFDILDGGTSVYVPGGTPIAVGGTVTSDINPAGETDSYGFTVASGERVYLDLLTTNSALRWSLFDPVGRAVFLDALAHPATNDQGPFQLAAGSYTLEVYATSGTPAYEFKLWPASEQVDNVTLGDNLLGVFTGPGDRHHYDFPVFSSPDPVYLDLIAGDIQLRGSLVDGGGQGVFSNETLFSTIFDDQGPLVLDQGSYRLTLNTQGGVLPLYSLDLAEVTDIDGGPIMLGVPEMDTVPGAGGIRRYTLTIAGEPKKVQFDITGDNLLRLSGVDSVGQALFADLTNFSTPPQIPLAVGDYFIDVYAIGGGTPSFTIDLQHLFPVLTLDPSSPFPFADTQVSQVSAGQEIQLGNDGTDTLEITAISESASAGCDQFDSQFPATPFSLENGEFENMTVTFAPLGRGSFFCEITIESNDPEGQVTYTVTGTGVGSELEVTPVILDFPPTHIGDPSGPLQFTLSNVGDAGIDLTIASVAIPAPDNDEDYVIGGFTGGVIAPGTSEMVDVTFQPQSAGNQAATLLINSDADINPNPSVELDGAGTERLIVLSPPTLNFGEVYAGQTRDRILTAQNPGEAVLSVTDISINGAQSSEFSIIEPGVLPTPGNPANIPGAGSLPLVIRCAPDTPGEKTASLEITSNADNTPDISATLNCMGIDSSDLVDLDGFE